MAITKNLGGDRLGSGAKMNVELHGYQSSTHNMDKTTRTTMSVGTLIPIFNQFMQKGDKWELDLNALLLTHPTEGPLFGKFKLQIDVFTADLRLYQGKLHMNMLEQGLKMNEIKFPQMLMKAQELDWSKDVNNQQINPSSIYAYLGIRGVGQSDAATDPIERLFNANKLLMYWDIYGNYYANKQEKVGYVIHNTDVVKWVTAVAADNGTDPPVAIPEDDGTNPPAAFIIEDSNDIMTITTSQTQPIDTIEIMIGDPLIFRPISEIFANITVSPTSIFCSNPRAEWFGYNIWYWHYRTPEANEMPQLFEFPLDNLNEMRMDILAAVKQADAFIIDDTSIAPYGLGLKKEGEIWSKTISQEGLGLKTYQSDLYNNWLNSEDINEINTRATIDVTSGGFTMEDFLLTEKLYQYLNRIVIAGNTVDDWEEATYGIKNKTRPEKPVYEGGLSKELVFEQVVSNSATESQPLGTIAGRGTLGGKHKGGKISIKAEEAGYIMVIASLTPYLDYYQGNQWDNLLETYEDIHKPAFDGIGFQNLITDQMAWWETYIEPGAPMVPIYWTAGKQPSWMNYQTNVNEVYGNFAIKSNEGWMVLTRDYEQDPTTKKIKDLTTYIDPAKWNDVFAYKARDAQNIWAQFHIGAKARRIMSANQIPNI